MGLLRHHHESHRRFRMQQKLIAIGDDYWIDLDGGSATVKKAIVGLRYRFEIDVDDGHDMKAHGNILDHEYKIERKGDTVAEISKRWFRVRDTYGVEIFDENATVLLLSITVAIDALANDLT